MIEIFEPQNPEQIKVLDDLGRMFERQYNMREAQGNPVLQDGLNVSTGDDLLDAGDSLLCAFLKETTGKSFKTHPIRQILLARREGIPREEIIALALHYFYPFTLFGVLPALYENGRIDDDTYEYVRKRFEV